MKLLAPNGKPSNLTPEQYALVRTPEFKAWFGDWENSPETASKVVDENGEPLVVYHGSNKKFYVFDPSKEGRNKKTIRMGGNAIYFSNKERVARMFTDNYGEGYVYPCFLLFKNPIFLDAEGGEISHLNQELKKIPNTKDIIVKNTIDVLDMYKGQYQKDYISDIYITSNPNNIKLADKLFKPIWTESGMGKLKTIGKTNTTFDANNPDIRYKNGGNIPKFNIESREGEEDRTTIYLKGIGEVVLVETFPEYEFTEDIDEDTLSDLGLSKGDMIGKIEHIEIKDEYKGKGYAKLLMKKAIELAKQKGLMPLYLNASPMGSKRYGLSLEDLTGFYESFGFKVFLNQGNNNLMILKEQDVKFNEGGNIDMFNYSIGGL